LKSALLMSVVVAVIAFPVLAARDPKPRRGMARMLLALLIFNALYVAYLTLVHPVVFVPSR